MESAGIHVIMDARVADSAVFTPAVLIGLFKEIVSTLNMKPLDDVKVYEVPVNPEILERVRRTGQFEDEGGISTIQVISTSHLSCHAWPLQNYFALDAFSCQYYDAEKALAVIRKRLCVTVEHTLIIKRRKPALKGDTSSVRYFEV